VVGKEEDEDEDFKETQDEDPKTKQYNNTHTHTKIRFDPIEQRMRWGRDETLSFCPSLPPGTLLNY